MTTIPLLLTLLVPGAAAYGSGKTGSSTAGCVPCHGASAGANATSTLTPASSTVEPGASLSVSFRVASTSSTHTAGGLDVSASGGTFSAGTGTQVSGGEITHTRDMHFSAGSATWSFTWTAPTTEGTYTLYGAGLAANDDHNATSVDQWDLDSVTVTVDDGCDDVDGDGVEACDDGTGADCDDGDAGVYPGAPETCDGEDDDCDGAVDVDPVDGSEVWPDDDGDGYGDTTGATERTCEATAPAGWSFDDLDCDDGEGAINPDADETCDGVDEDCDGAVDGPGSIDASTFYRDADGDGFGDAAVTTPECAAPAGYVADDTDCDDTRAGVSPAAIEVCDALDLDEDCDGGADDADAAPTGTTTYYADTDADGYGGATTTEACALPAGHSTLDGDCDDTDTAYTPAATEVCTDPRDLNCDGSTGYVDGDGDGVAACEDCDDADATALPGGTEVCDGADDDCDGVVDEADASGAPVWFVDADADGYGSTAAAVVSCTQPEGYDDDALDCDDADAGARPDAPETWYDGVDQDCDGADDDQDGDGFVFAADCDDEDAAVFPGATEIYYDGVDQDCAGDSDLDADGDGRDSESHGGDDCDDADAATFPGAQDEPWDGVVTDCDAADEYDADGDGYDLDADCDDARSDVNPGAQESWYDGLDQDCDGNDTDQDGDGVAVGVDCDDTDADVLIDCGGGDTAIPVEDTGDEQVVATPEGEEGCGCATARGPTRILAMVGALLLARWRRVGTARPA